MYLQIETAKSFESLRRCADGWDNLALESVHKSPMLSYSWVSTYLENRLQPKEGWICLLAHDGSTLVGVLPLVIQRRSMLGKPVTIYSTPQDLHTLSGDLLVKSGYETHFLGAILSALDRNEPNCLSIEMRGVVEYSPTMKLGSTNDQDMIIMSDFSRYASYIKITKDFEEFKKGLSFNFQANLRKARNKLNKRGNVAYRYQMGKDAVEKHFTMFLDLEASGWKGKEGTAIKLNQDLVAFYSSLVHRLAERGWLEWHFLIIEGKPTAGHLAVRMGRRLTLLKIAYDETYSECAPGNMLLYNLIERAYQSDDTDEIDCLTDMPWHRNWDMPQKKYYRVMMYPRRPLPLFYSYLPHVARNIAKRVPGIRPLVRRIRNGRSGGAKSV